MSHAFTSHQTTVKQIRCLVAKTPLRKPPNPPPPPKQLHRNFENPSKRIQSKQTKNGSPHLNPGGGGSAPSAQSEQRRGGGLGRLRCQLHLPQRELRFGRHVQGGLGRRRRLAHRDIYTEPKNRAKTTTSPILETPKNPPFWSEHSLLLFFSPGLLYLVEFHGWRTPQKRKNMHFGGVSFLENPKHPPFWRTLPSFFRGLGCLMLFLQGRTCSEGKTCGRESPASLKQCTEKTVFLRWNDGRLKHSRARSTLSSSLCDSLVSAGTLQCTKAGYVMFQPGP